MSIKPTLETPGLMANTVNEGPVSGVMTALTAAATFLAIFSVILFLGFLLFIGGSWLLEAQTVITAGGVEERYNWQVLFSGESELSVTGGIFPAIVGTVVVTLLMAVIVAPLGIVVAVYLTEYASDGWSTQLLRIGVQNLAAIPSIIYGVFGLAFFVYVIGGRVDALFFESNLPDPTFGAPGLLWASLTLAILTLPTVIVATEEGLSRLPATLREGSRALGATRVETVLYVVIPAATPSILTGVILAVARAAGEVAPLMLVGVVKYAPSLPIGLEAPFIHLEQKFMHLGFFVYDLTMHAPAGDGRLGIVAAAGLLLVAVIVTLNIVALLLRMSLRRRYVQTGLD
ncbi:MAG: phosphate ABC transporter permease PstA [Luminiphilus sp.]|nr:phosphate ABC transporter permease PstA [Luminiphilus sp.]